MPIDASIYKSQAPDILGSLQQGLNMREMIDQRALQKKQLAEQDQIKQAYAKNLVQGEDGKMSYNRGGLMSDLVSLDPKQAMGMQDRFSKQDAQAKEMQDKNQQKTLEMFARVAPTMKDQASYEQGLNFLKQQGVDLGDAPREFDPGLVNRYASASMSYLDQQKQKNSDRSFDLQKEQQQFAKVKHGDEMNYRNEKMMYDSREKKLAAQQKLQKEKEGIGVFGMEVADGATPTKEDAKKVKAAITQKDNIVSSLGKLNQLVKDHGTEAFTFGGTASQDMSQLATDARMGAKDLYELGVLTGPDMELLESVIPDPSDKSWLLTPNSAEKVKVQIAKAKKIIEEKAGTIAKNRGYITKDERGDMDSQKRQDRIAELRAKMGKGRVAGQ